ncbi:Uncharacterised protein [Halioglobus japonicus]|nr:Uncharacterised protein [Halioglobus japonicus]
MSERFDSQAPARFKEHLAQNAKNYIDYSEDVVFSLDPADLEKIQLGLLRDKYSAAIDSIAIVKQMAGQNEISSIESFDDLLPIFFNQETFRSYPQSWLENGDFKRMTKWLGKLCAVDLSAVDASACESIEDWIAALKQHSSVDLMISAGGNGKAAFLPRTREEWATAAHSTLWGIQRAMEKAGGGSLALRPGIDRVPLIYPGARSGARSWRFLNFYEETFGADLVDAPLGYTDADLLTLAGRIREASRKGEAGSLQINPALLARKDEIARLNAEKPQRIEALMQRMLEDYRDQRVIFYSSMQMLYDLAMRFEKQGIKSAYSSDSFFFCGGGFISGSEPAHWKRDAAAALGIPESSILIGYGMQESLTGMQMCDHGKYHVPVTLIPFVLSEVTDQPLERRGSQTGRFAFFDLQADTSWGGYITSDRVTIHWDEPCKCGHKGAYLDASIGRVTDLQDDKIGCAGTAGALDDAADFLLKA